MNMVLTRHPICRTFTETDLLALIDRDGGLTCYDHIIESAKSGPAVTAVLDEQVLGCAGIVLPWPGLGIAWMLLGHDIASHGIWLTKTVRRFLDDMTRLHQLHRIEAVALDDSTRNQAWLEHFGFTREREGLAQRYLADQRSVVRYERVRS